MITLQEGLKALRIPWTEEQLHSLETYVREVERWNPDYRLTAAGGEDFLVRHVFDSLAAFPVLNEEPPGKIADIGSGAGLPGIPLIIFLPRFHLTLIERSGRRAGFLRNVIALLGLKERVNILEVDLKGVRETFNIIVFRAFRNLLDWYMPLEQRCADGGLIVAYKGKKAVVKGELEELQKRGLMVGKGEILPLEVPFLEEERHLLLIRK